MAPNNYLIETANLSFKFKDQLVLDGLNLQVHAGSIYGFLGPNGSGKTTTIKLLLNLLHSAKKNIFLFGKEISSNRNLILSKVGSLVEQPALYQHLSGSENLINRALLIGMPKTRVKEVLQIVGLQNDATKKVKAYSMGMKQKLGIALALLPDPDLFILDEPTNGLDPKGMIQIRMLLKSLVEDHKKSVFVSSHLLSEIEKTATHVGILNKGKLLFQGTINSLDDTYSRKIRINTNDPLSAKEILCNRGYKADVNKGMIELPFVSPEEMSKVNSLLICNNLKLYTTEIAKTDLEDYFLEATKN
ncbi:MAG: ATP-binding cassette domain-containing protein [Ginsengibacter sp.]